MDNFKYKWRYSDNDRPKGVCYDCKMKYSDFPDMSIPDDLWEEINPTYHNGAGLLCPTCIANRLNYLKRWYSLVILIEDSIDRALKDTRVLK
jgi:hypothetical protein